jgi:protein-disulfide isomerase
MMRAWRALLAVVLPLAALTVAGFVMWGIVRPTQPRANATPLPRFMVSWEDAAPSGRRIGPADAAARVIVFSDLQCEYCSRFHSTLTTVMRQHPGKVSYTFVHFPLRSNRESVAAARLVECAWTSGRASELIDVIFEHQDSLPSHNWLWFARTARLGDLPALADCIATSEFPDMVTRGLAMGAWMSVRGTPVVILNGWWFSGAPDDTTFVRAVNDIVDGRDPYPNLGGAQSTVANGMLR